MNINQPADHIVLPFMKRKNPDAQDADQHRRLWIVKIMPNRLRAELVAAIGEFVGTFMFLFLAFSATQVANFVAPAVPGTPKSAASAPNTSNLLYISLAFGFSLAVNAWVFFRISGGLFNPAVTLGMCLIGAIGWMRGLVVFISQILGGIAAAGIVSCLFPGPLDVITGLSSTPTALVSTSIVRGLFIEMFLTAELVFTIFMLAAEKHKATFIAPVGIGLALFICEMAGVYFTGGSLNPARSFGPCVIAGHFQGYHWIYWLGPALGSLVAVGFYKLVKGLEYETVNPGQDANDKDAEKFADDAAAPTHGTPALVSGDQSAVYGGPATGYSGPATHPRVRREKESSAV